MLAKVRRTIQQHGMLAPGERVLVAVSGGPDSTALLAVLTELAAALSITVQAAHFNHGVRGAESERDQALAVDNAGRFGVPITIGRAAGPFPSGNFESRARAARYDFLHAVAGSAGCSKIATGHTRDDQAETVLMRPVRGTGPRGLSGILPARRDGVIRPLLRCSRREVLRYLAASQVRYADDSSNADRRYLRNRVRSEILPMLRDINPAVAHALSNLADLARDDQTHLMTCTEAALDSVRAPAGGLDVTAVAGVSASLRASVVRRWLGEQRGDISGVGRRHLRAMLDLLVGEHPNGIVRLPGGGCVARSYGTARYIAECRPAEPWDACSLDAGGSVRLPNGWLFLASVARATVPFDRQAAALNFSFYADAAMLAEPRFLRPAVPGDRVQPFGMQGHRKLQDVFVDRRVPRPLRLTYPVLVAGTDVVWVPGVLRSGVAPVSPTTSDVLEITAVPPP